MHQLVSGDSQLRRACRKCVSFAEHWFVKNLVRPIIFVLPPSIVTAAASRSSIGGYFEPFLSPNVSKYLQDSALPILVGAFLYVAIVQTIFSAIQHYSKPERELGREDLNAILTSLNRIVGDKMKRFVAYTKDNLSRQYVCPKETFRQITQPKQQMEVLVAGIQGIFEYLIPTASFRAGLLIVKDGMPVEWLHYEPTVRQPRTSAEDLQHPTSTVMHAIRTKSPILVEDIFQELSKASKKARRYFRGNTQENEEGSQFCYPIVHPSTGNVVYVITVAGDKKCCLEDKHLPLYKWIVEHYSLRISLEHCLLLMKEKANEQIK